jgi:hypothetical protein
MPPLRFREQFGITLGNAVGHCGAFAGTRHDELAHQSLGNVLAHLLVGQAALRDQLVYRPAG